MKPSVAFASAMLVVASASADNTMIMNKGEMKWGDVPPVLPKGGKITVLNGDPFKPGPFTLRLMMPANYKIAPHWHTKDENLTVISGTLGLGLADKMDGKTHDLKAGGYHYLPGKTHHYAIAKGQTVVQVSGDGPFDITYVNAADDPSTMAKKEAMRKQ
jgi:hypothetical protein